MTTAVKDLDNYTATSVTRQIVALAKAAGLRPKIEPERRRSYRIVVDAPGTDGLFGAVTVGAETGRILYAHLTHGNDGQERRYDAVAEIRSVFKSWAALRRIPVEPEVCDDLAGLDWTAMEPERFDTDVKPVQYALFAAPDRCGTPDLFDSEWN